MFLFLIYGERGYSNGDTTLGPLLWRLRSRFGCRGRLLLWFWFFYDVNSKKETQDRIFYDMNKILLVIARFGALDIVRGESNGGRISIFWFHIAYIISLINFITIACENFILFGSGII